MNAITGVPSVKPYFSTKYADTVPTCVREATAGRSLRLSSGAVADISSGLNSQRDRSSRFMPAPSPKSMGAERPDKIDAMKLLTS